MAISKVIFNGQVLMDVTNKTVDSNKLLSGETALKNDGTDVVGNITSKSSSDLTASGATVTAPAGYYAEAASKSVATTTHPSPTASINSSTGVVTASHTQGTGYVTGGTTTDTLNLTTQAAQTITPSTSSQIAVAAGKYTTGTVTVAAIPSQYIVPSGTKEITENGTGIDVSSYAAVDVAVPGQEPTGIKYVYSDIDGEGAWNVSDYQYVSYNFDPVRDGKFRYWIDLTSEDLTFSPKVSVPTAIGYRHTGIIDWGDGTQTDYDYDTAAQRHEYANPGRYCVSVVRTGGYEGFFIASPATEDKAKIIATEIHFLNYQTSTLSLRNCPNLKKVRISSQQTKIGLFGGSSLNDIIIPDSTTEIANSCFQDCNELKTIIIPSGILTIGGGAFIRAGSSTNKLTVTMLATTPPTLGNSAFTDSNLNKIYVPATSLEAYKTATNWSEYASYMEAII